MERGLGRERREAGAHPPGGSKCLFQKRDRKGLSPAAELRGQTWGAEVEEGRLPAR